MLIQEKVIKIIYSGPSNPIEAFMKNMMMSKNPRMFNNKGGQQKSFKKPNQQDEK